MHQSFLVYHRHRYLKLALLLLIAAVAAYVWQKPEGPPNGGTWLGYVLGTVSALLIVWLMWLGVRKRRYRSTLGSVEGWTSAHVYLGLTLLVFATLHTGFRFGFNVHTLAYVLMVAVIVSGIYGVYAYMRYPRLMTENRRAKALDALLGEIAEIDRECREAALTLSNEINRAVLHSSEDTRLGGSPWRQLSGHDPRCATAAGLRRVQEAAKHTPPEHAMATRRLVVLLNRKTELLARARKDIQYKALMDIWLYVHVPLSFALLAALIAHIVAEFTYW